MVESPVAEWALDGVLAEMANIHASMKDRQFAFILGSGASFTSGIPTGHHLAERWIKDLHLRECLDSRPLEEWIASCGIGGGQLTLETVAEHYPQIFERRFEGDREAGYAELEAAMEGKSPSLGYSLLAEIIERTRHKVVVTTNFDNLVADALAMHAHQSPLVVAHESLAGFVRPQLRRPLVAKIHRDLFLHPINDTVGVSTLEQGWRIALKKLFQYFTPVVVGYGGNDGSLMDMLLELEEGDIAGRMLWCYREGARPPEKALQVLRKHKGLMVKIAGFDEFMLQLAAKLVEDFDVAAIAERTAKLGQDRAERYRKQASELRETSSRGSVEKQKAGAVLSESVRSGKSWWAWELQAQAAVDLDERNRIYKQGLRLFPRSAGLIGNYANFLGDQRKDYVAAEAMYRKALEIDPDHANNTGNYANFLADQRKDDAAEAMYNKALGLAPTDVDFLANFASALLTRGDDASVKAVVPLVQRLLKLWQPDLSQAVAEGLLYGALVHEIAPDAELADMLGRLKGVLLAGYPKGDWDFSPVSDSILPRLPEPRRQLFSALMEAILDKERLPALDSIESWRELEAIDPFAG
ncbi:SIR2 family protein [Paracidovorax konjaci]|uniref:Tetratricopeptide repeat-containing protein n=1 Tax=Paracidovorax konjaci TaxID=32040 RepID=A0A1I1WUD9_9BURK|nr:SIR2 family protein [Paracidovorax konjaci]SFD98726.1 Tetratricopeptide repeat-containing protein [Paracidovorax konjaci]